jgi:hypothetical protein
LRQRRGASPGRKRRSRQFTKQSRAGVADLAGFPPSAAAGVDCTPPDPSGRAFVRWNGLCFNAPCQQGRALSSLSDVLI